MTSVSPSLLRTVDFRSSDAHGAELARLMPRVGEDHPDVRPAVESVIDDVRSRGHEALAELAERFDGGSPSSVRVPPNELVRALEELDPAVRAALEASIERARVFAGLQIPGAQTAEFPGGARVTAKYTPVDRVGVYVPGGLAVYPSSVVMNVVPAQAAGVESIALATPPQKEFGGLPHPVILAAAELLGVTEVLAVGGAQAVAALAYGVPASRGQEGIAPVDVITGPGNIFVATAKGLVRGVVGIDAEAGPTEIAIIADADATAEFIAADLISQAEHDPRAASVLITDSEQLGEAVRKAVLTQAESAKHRERVIEALSGRQSGILLVRDMDHAVQVADAYGAEHLEILTAQPHDLASRIRHAGAVFVGEHSPVSLGDYCAGSNHVLPTSGTARRASGLNVLSFMKLVQVIEYPKAALSEVAPHIRALSDAEDLPAHGDAVDIRTREA